eukprot:gnl/TRDRNA2_/TRDRNA2_137178_c0_seq2.p2 gnl/TRDRNA2_/TRDRNA2_137178_c0~~gnl/TRDRNA2_/TRDRNA2_137178_c0_seq2.p2  ORF type:complete len:153 (-),score=19.45 gnl/TRDRNA2_/TRDRNA2_137178_c0_seq2:48-506(-)
MWLRGSPHGRSRGGLSMDRGSLTIPPAADSLVAAAPGASASLAPAAAGESEFAAALNAHFVDGFVATLRSSEPGAEAFIAHCARGIREDQSGPSLTLTVTDCLSGIFQRRLEETALSDLRRNAGMAEFAWSGFLRLLAAAFRGATAETAKVR